jgi:hypothetical protein
MNSSLEIQDLLSKLIAYISNENKSEQMREDLLFELQKIHKLSEIASLLEFEPEVGGEYGVSEAEYKKYCHELLNLINLQLT